MESYTKSEEVKQKYNTTDDLLRLLKESGHAHDIGSIRRWERMGIIPKPKRVMVKGFMWRVYDKEGNDFRVILESLDKRTYKRVQSL